ncbi:hypothetical protein GH733_017343, partial [Mirounga leonina]
MQKMFHLFVRPDRIHTRKNLCNTGRFPVSRWEAFIGALHFLNYPGLLTEFYHCQCLWQKPSHYYQLSEVPQCVSVTP